MKKIIAIILSISVLYGCGQFSNNALLSIEKIDQLIRDGEYTTAEEIIKLKIAADSLTKQEIYDLNFRVDVMNRIRKDFSKTDSTVIAYIKERYPNVTPQELAKWEAEGALECKIIDGQKKYFWNAARNLFRISKEAQEKQQGIQGRQSDELDIFLADYLPKVTKAAGSAYCKEGKAVMPVTMKLRYTITVPAGEVPAGEMIRVWMPYPRNNEKHKNIKLLSTSQPEYIISPETYV
ncbi:MAG: transglutaminase domain-containing protein, partial [Bacteroidales bacterium]|nr:transglutaminase domain-containing protein [Bacteroidales bacterium]